MSPGRTSKAAKDPRRPRIYKAQYQSMGCPALFFSKKDGSSRLSIDYRALNRLKFKDSYLLQIIEDILDHLLEAKYFTKIDLRSGFHQIRLDKE